jgi:hypothetical protein
MGVKYQAHPRDEVSQITIHVRMLDHENSLQQAALGIVGINLLYGAFFFHHKPEWLLESLLDGLSTERIEIDMIEFSGIEYRHVDNRVMSLRLVQLGLSGAAMFGPSGEVLQPSEVLRKRPVLVERGSFRPVTKVNIDMMRSARERFEAEPEVAGKPVMELMEVTMRNLLSAGKLDLNDFLARADVLAAVGKTVLISDYFEYFRLASYLARYTSEPIAIAMGIGSVRELFEEQYYTGLEGGILEAFGKLFTNNLRLYAYPLAKNGAEMQTAENVNMPGQLCHLYQHLRDAGRIRQLDNFDPGVLHIFSRDVLARIKGGDLAWEGMVPQEVADLIRRRRLFGYREADVMESVGK